MITLAVLDSLLVSVAMVSDTLIFLIFKLSVIDKKLEVIYLHLLFYPPPID